MVIIILYIFNRYSWRIGAGVYAVREGEQYEDTGL